ncbi:MAG: hypothetical protein JXC36_09135 [Candidatus Atribacteria bacterium]|nr:hypothetical protein [Candidatus Atribacteria bacterium]
MGSWGTAISSNDTYADIKDEFFNLYNDNLEIEEIKSTLINNNQDIIKSNEDCNNFWFALAHCLWECKALDDESLLKVTMIIDSGKDIELWENLGASLSDINKRKKVLQIFKEKISIEKDKPKKRKKKILRDSIFEKGDCLTFKLISGQYGGVVILEAEKQTEFGLNLVAMTNIQMNQKPDLKEFERSNILITPEEIIPGKINDREVIEWNYAKMFKNCGVEFEKIGQLKINDIFSPDKDYQSFSRWDIIPEYFDISNKRENDNWKAKRNLKVKEFIKRKWFFK